MKKRKLTVFVVGMALLLLVSGVVYAAQHDMIMIQVDGRNLETDVAPLIVDGRTLVPIRFIAENFGADVHWVAETRTVDIVSPAKKFAGNFVDRGMYQINATQAMQRANAGTAVVLDVSPPASRETGYVMNSMYVPLPAVPDRLDEFDSNQTYLVYCVMDINSAYAVAILNMAGINAYVVVGGMDALEEAGAVVTVDDDQDAVSMDIVDTAVAAGSFTTLVAALEAADLVDALRGPGPFTCFAPTDDAFAKLPAGTLASLLEPENKETLQSILLYHVVPGKVMAETVVTLEAAETMQGQSVSIAVIDGSVFVDDAEVIITDIECTNGVIHVIDTVLIPE